MKILLIAWFDPNGINTVKEHIFSLQRYSQHQIEILNTYHFSKKLHFFNRVSTQKFDAIIFHNTVTYSVSMLRKLNHCFWPTLSSFKGKKILMKQDEMRRVNECLQLIEDWDVDSLVTCVPKEEIPKVYPPSRFPRLNILNVLTGYVTEEMKVFKPKDYRDRHIDVCYRGMETPFEWGSLGYEKFWIGEEFLRRTAGSKLRTDISSKTKDRLMGTQWIDLLNSSKAVLAVESGASIFDWDGTIEKTCQELRLKNPDMTFTEVYERYLFSFDHNVNYAQISPRHFEAATTHTLQVLFEGAYSDLLKPNIHYLCLQKDFSNIETVVELIKDPETYSKLTQNAFKDLILNPTLSYSFFVNSFDQLLSK